VRLPMMNPFNKTRLRELLMSAGDAVGSSRRSRHASGVLPLRRLYGIKRQNDISGDRFWRKAAAHGHVRSGGAGLTSVRKWRISLRGEGKLQGLTVVP
jgi:hypothetical protein